MATTLASIVTQVRNQLIETTASFWSDSELLAIMRLGAADLWGAILDLHQDHFFKINDTDVYLRANQDALSGVPDDCFRVQLIEPRDTSSSGSGHAVIFTPKKYKSTEFAVARTQSAQDVTSSPSRQVYYQIVGVGAPTEAPRIVVAPKLLSDLPLRLVYSPSFDWPEDAEDGGLNPVPGESDNALKAWTVAYARAKETDARTPDAGWLAVYGTEKQLILTRLTPREEQEPEVVEDLFQGFGSLW